MVILVLARDIPFESLRSLICPWVFKNSFKAVVYWRGTLGQILTCLGISLAFCVIMEMASRPEKSTDREMVVSSFFALIGVKDCYGGSFSFVLCV